MRVERLLGLLNGFWGRETNQKKERQWYAKASWFGRGGFERFGITMLRVCVQRRHS
jgi:hypothetical protein